MAWKPAKFTIAPPVNRMPVIWWMVSASSSNPPARPRPFSLPNSNAALILSEPPRYPDLEYAGMSTYESRGIDTRNAWSCVALMCAIMIESARTPLPALLRWGVSSRPTSSTLIGPLIDTRPWLSVSAPAPRMPCCLTELVYRAMSTLPPTIVPPLAIISSAPSTTMRRAHVGSRRRRPPRPAAPVRRDGGMAADPRAGGRCRLNVSCMPVPGASVSPRRSGACRWTQRVPRVTVRTAIDPWFTRIAHDRQRGYRANLAAVPSSVRDVVVC